MCRLFADDHVAQHTWDQMFGKWNGLMRRLAAKNRLAGMVEARGEDVRDAAPLDTAERGRSSAGFMLMSVWTMAWFL
jgi:hypothetical protein